MLEMLHLSPGTLSGPRNVRQNDTHCPLEIVLAT